MPQYHRKDNMLGWFKKKFSKKTDTAPKKEEAVLPPIEVEEVEQVVNAPREVVATGKERKEPSEIEAVIEPEEPPTATAIETAPAPLAQEDISAPPLAPEEVSKKEKVIALKPITEMAAAPAPAKAEPKAEPKPEQATEAEKSSPPAPPALIEKKPSKEEKKPSLFKKLSARLAKSREAFTYQLDSLFLGKKEIDTNLLDDLEELLIMADLGVSTTDEILEFARRKAKRKELSDPAALKEAIKTKIASFIEEAQEDAELVMPESGPFIIMVIGVNGVGKTTTIGKIAKKFVNSGNSVMLVAADTFRAAAVSQLKIWGERNEVPVFSRQEGADPSSVAYDAIAKAVAEEYDVVLIDTAGRLHTQTNLMEELKKIKRVIGKNCAGAPHEIMLVIDATTGQNGISQAKLFNDAVGITGITLTKLDGTAKGGIVANISRELDTPIRFIGIGEQIDDLRDFDHNEFIEALFQTRDN
ncbi:probable cell division protein FtsY [Desulfotalea psychrophila LSv54]|uniref:Signal recognition particle receptor FtsY n=2 Tax=Desulfotalea psychrophila TaxID=84980 RepID=Q6AJ15_DESPS|nr:probable cell division protein FtsY [Desulfotalea psychrophila LSv54]